MTTSDTSTEFIFGTLSTDNGRAQRARALRVGLQHTDVLDPLDPRPGETVTVSVRAGVGVAIREATLHATFDGSDPDPASAGTLHLPMRRAHLEWDTLVWSHVETWQAAIPGQADGTRVRYLITAVTITGEALTCPAIPLAAPEVQARAAQVDQRVLHRLLRSPGPHVYEYRPDDAAIPDWLREAVIYQIFVDRFAPDPGHDFADEQDLSRWFGGTLRGITSRLDYLSDLGVTCLWLTPIFASPSHHGYDPTDYFALAPRLGSENDLRALVEAAHERGIRIVLDFVANHLSRQHPAFVSAQTDPDSPTRDWFFFRRYPDEYEAFYDVPDQPIVNTDRPAARDYLLRAAQYWLELGCDGYRLDHAHGATHGFWSAFREATRAAKADTVTFGEITDTPELMRSYTGRMDGVLDFYLLEILRRFFAFQDMAPSAFDRALTQHRAYFGDALLLPSFLDNHDMNRFLWLVGGDTRRLKLAALCQFTLPGPPILYYGTEVGVSQRKAVGRLEESRLPMVWGDAQDLPLLSFYRRLIGLRRSSPGLWTGARMPVCVDDGRGLYAYRVADFTVWLNNRDAPAPVEAPGVLALTTNEDVMLNDGALMLPPFAGAIVRDR